ncbi:MAG: type II toxin-antitoxin system VapC family toxin [Chloroflexota bacterium]|nr:type II toxin-antitoxin system VapC family toxin [Chloroflexota bacterium]
MRYLLDTNICIYLIKKQPQSVLQKFSTCMVGEVGISSITIAELEYGVSKSLHQSRNRQALQGFLSPLVALSFDERAAVIYGEIRATLEKEGTPIGSLDTLIAAHALSLGVTLVTNNVKEFKRVPNLNYEDWV